MFFFLLTVFFASCAPLETKRKEEPAPITYEEPPRISIEEQGTKSIEIFKKILEVSESSEERSEVVPQIEAMYRDITIHYPDAPLAQESYQRLIQLYLKEYRPPDVDKAEEIYGEFLRKYPSSPMKSNVENTLSRFYYRSKMWNKLIELFRFKIKQFIETEKLESPYPLFMYSEAQYNLGETEEAEKGYEWIIRTFPNTSIANVSKKRIDDMGKGK
jgi:TolA-binding protein